MSMLSEKLLLEQPHVFLDMDPDEEDPEVWDFCAEDKPRTWIVQLVELYAIKKLVTLNKRKNHSDTIRMTDEEIAKFTDNLLADPFFLIQAKQCVNRLMTDDQNLSVRMLKKYLPLPLQKALGLVGGIEWVQELEPLSTEESL